MDGFKGKPKENRINFSGCPVLKHIVKPWHESTACGVDSIIANHSHGLINGSMAFKLKFNRVEHPSH